MERAAELYSESDSEISAEDMGENILLPLARYFTPDQIQDILINGVKENAYIVDAGKTPEILEQFFENTIHYLDQTKDSWQILITRLIEDFEDAEIFPYSDLRKKLKKYGIDRIPLLEETE